MLGWLREHVLWIVGLTILTFVATLIAIPFVVVRMHPDYFVSREPPPDSWRGQHRAVRIALLAGKNCLGVVLILFGIIMLVAPGQGVLTILIGLSLVDFPGKRALELRIARQRHILTAINWIRAKADRPPLRLPADRDG